MDVVNREEQEHHCRVYREVKEKNAIHQSNTQMSFQVRVAFDICKWRHDELRANVAGELVEDCYSLYLFVRGGPGEAATV